MPLQLIKYLSILSSVAASEAPRNVAFCSSSSSLDPSNSCVFPLSLLSTVPKGVEEEAEAEEVVSMQVEKNGDEEEASHSSLSLSLHSSTRMSTYGALSFSFFFF